MPSSGQPSQGMLAQYPKHQDLSLVFSKSAKLLGRVVELNMRFAALSQFCRLPQSAGSLPDITSSSISLSVKSLSISSIPGDVASYKSSCAPSDERDLYHGFVFSMFFDCRRGRGELRLRAALTLIGRFRHWKAGLTLTDAAEASSVTFGPRIGNRGDKWR